MSSRGKVLLLFFALFNKLENVDKQFDPCITILPTAVTKKPDWNLEVKFKP